MKIITKVVQIDNYGYYVRHLELLNVILPYGESKFPKEKMTPKEIEVLAAFMSQDKGLIDEDIFNGVVRKKVMEKINIAPGGLGNHLKSLIEKEFLDKNNITKKITVKPYLFPEDNHQGFRLKLVKV